MEELLSQREAKETQAAPRASRGSADSYNSAAGRKGPGTSGSAQERGHGNAPRMITTCVPREQGGGGLTLRTAVEHFHLDSNAPPEPVSCAMRLPPTASSPSPHCNLFPRYHSVDSTDGMGGSQDRSEYLTFLSPDASLTRTVRIFVDEGHPLAIGRPDAAEQGYPQDLELEGVGASWGKFGVAGGQATSA